MNKGDIDCKAIDYMGSFIDNYVCLLDDPVMRRIALEMEVREATIILNNETPCRSSDEFAVKQVARAICNIYRGVSYCSGNRSESVVNSKGIHGALRVLALNVSTREDRIIACRQIVSYPYHLRYSDKEDETLDENDLCVATCVKYALNLIGKAIPLLRKEVKA